MNYRILILSIVIFSFIICSCKKDNPTSPAKNPQITSISPTSAFIGGSISIIGTNFGATQGTSFVSFNSLKAIDILSWNESYIKVKVPVGATSGKLSITSNSVKSNEVDFDVLTIVISDTIKIGKQVWMLKNLDVDHYRNGDSIPEVSDTSAWAKLVTGAWCYYNNDPAMGAIYGKLYNWYAVNDPRGLAPIGWHVASDSEWTILSSYLGGEYVAGGKLKTIGTKESGNGLWYSPNTGATNESGFSALPGGFRYFIGSDYQVGYFGFWWSSTEKDQEYAWCRYLMNTFADVGKFYFNKGYGYSVRCIKDN